MCKEAARASTCQCGLVIAFPEYHWPHCPKNPANRRKAK